VSISILIGLQWGDEGKGKMVDILAKDHKHIVRSHGGANAGHTLVIRDKEFKFHLVPSGILHANCICYLAGGVVLDPEIFFEELDRLNAALIDYKNKLFISKRAHVLFPYHKIIDQITEKTRGKGNIGTTGKGIGPCYTDKTARLGITLEELLDQALFEERITQRYAFLTPDIISLYPLEKCLEDASRWRKLLASFVIDVEHTLNQAVKVGEKVLLEGAHGSMLDVSYGTYPFVTSSGCIAASVLAGAGLGPTFVKRVCGVVKAYTTRVGSGPLPTALTQTEQSFFVSHEKAREIGTTTGRQRRMGWLDLPLLKRSIELSGVTEIVLTKLDILDDLAEIKVCTHYELDDKVIDIFPSDTSILDKITPKYVTLKGWKQKTSEVIEFMDLPKECRDYIHKVEDMLGVKIRYVFVGPDREQTLVCP
jgi:adenylosuccinate synthase